jgi:hypothetical protein
MPANVPGKIAFLEAELTGLRTRTGGSPNAVQHSKLQMLRDIRDDYAQSLERAKQREAEQE